MFEAEQTYFAEELDAINQIYIKTSYGNIFAQAVGKPGQPLIIVVHGSGPKNSSDQYMYFLHQYLVRVSYIEKFFIIAIDCPGYGRSKGSKQAVKTFPLQMFKEILVDLNYTSYFAMFGHSQGGAAIFNAVYQQPSLTEFLLMDRPVCGNIKRFNKFPLPTLLVYDIEDDGHPIWQGKLLFKQLLKSEMHTYRHSRDPYYVPDNLWNLVLSFIKRNSRERRVAMTSNFNRSEIQYHSATPTKRSKSKTQKKQKMKNFSMDKCEDIKKEKKEKQKQIMEIKEIDRSELYSMMADLEEFEDLPPSLNQPKIEESPEDIRREEEEIMRRKTAYQTNFMKKKSQRTEEMRQETKIQKKEIQKKEPIKDQIKTEQKKQKTQIKRESTKKRTEGSEDSNTCSICYETVYHPMETNCKHIFCKKCIGECYLVNQHCPLCRAQITKRTFKETLHEKIIENMSAEERTRRESDLHKFQQMLKSIVYIEIGNNSRELPTKQSHFSRTKKKYMWEVYAKQPKNFKFDEVCFNINMGDLNSKPIKMSNAPFSFESRGTFSFSCEITIKPRNKDYAPIVSIYRIDVAPGNHSKLIALRKKKS